MFTKTAIAIALVISVASSAFAGPKQHSSNPDTRDDPEATHSRHILKRRVRRLNPCSYPCSSLTVPRWPGRRSASTLSTPRTWRVGPA